MSGTGSVYVSSATKASYNTYSVTVKFDIAFDWGGWNSEGAYYDCWADGMMQDGYATFSVSSGGGSWVWTNIATKTYTVTMPTSGSAKTIQLGATINTGVNPSTITAYSSYTLPALTWQWAVTYNANGGSGAPSSQTKTYGTNLTLSSTKPTRTGYTFQGWATSSGGSVAYQPGGTYSTDAAITLYAVWKIDTYTVSYNANGGSGAPSSQTKTYGTNLTLSSTKPTRTNYNFLGWGVSSGSTTVSYAAGGTYSANAAITLYAIWELAYVPPSITNLIASRCDESGNNSEVGTHFKLSFDWKCDQTIGSNPVKSIVYSINNGSNYTITVDTTEISGSVSLVHPDTIDIETSHLIRVLITDSEDGTHNPQTTIPATTFPIDVLTGGRGVAMGKPAEMNNYLDMNFYSKFRKPVDIDSTLNVDGTAAFQSLASFGGGIDEITRIYAGDCDDVTKTCNLYCGNSATNKPGSGLNGWLTTKVYGSGDYIYQEYVTYTGLRYYRMKEAGTWGTWYIDDPNNIEVITGYTVSGLSSATVSVTRFFGRLVVVSYGGSISLGAWASVNIITGLPSCVYPNYSTCCGQDASGYGAVPIVTHISGSTLGVDNRCSDHASSWIFGQAIYICAES